MPGIHKKLSTRKVGDKTHFILGVFFLLLRVVGLHFTRAATPFAIRGTIVKAVAIAIMRASLDGRRERLEHVSSHLPLPNGLHNPACNILNLIGLTDRLAL